MIGKIYIIENDLDNSVYIGSTTNFKKRVYNHNHYLKKETINNNLYSNLKDKNIKDIHINILEEVNYNTKNELRRREGQIIKEYKQNENYNVINKNIAGRTREERYIDNKEILNNKFKIYYLKNKEKINARNLNNYYKKKNNNI